MSTDLFAMSSLLLCCKYRYAFDVIVATFEILKYVECFTLFMLK